MDRGEFEITVGEQRRRLAPREGTVVPAGVEHSLTTGPGARLIELWYPVKQDG